ncbi:hypothetical protein BDB00DRAFT_33176 [Zychaea mexicana]|uniref:uncharacterized protein n=1 Tax=Zychaea mexicana TaxID=64656 RepID=UPI0022FE4CF6|nr:uncharacterized protein BDB00DRAFT_33176 [Zychaea mexicana]KAI9488620.1 hypothetical protein BDB00DRAFT_33176 [Zychaea mexicana]
MNYIMKFVKGLAKKKSQAVGLEAGFFCFFSFLHTVVQVGNKLLLLLCYNGNLSIFLSLIRCYVSTVTHLKTVEDSFLFLSVQCCSSSNSTK